jgi:heptosyltransferase-2
MTYINILLNSVNWVGDTILITPSIHLVRTEYPDAKITVLARPWVADVLKDNPDIDELWIDNEAKDAPSFFRVIKRIRQAKFDLGIAFPNSFISAFILRLGGVKHIVGYSRDGRGILLSEKIPVTEEILHVHQVEYYLNILQNICNLNNAERKLVLPVTQEGVKDIKEVLKREGIPVRTKHPIIGINPGAFYGSAKRWLPDRYATVADHLVKKFGAKIVTTGTEKERPIAEEVISYTRGKNVFNLAGKVTLRELVPLLSLLDLYITNDSGAMHVAAAVGCPIVAIFGSTDWVTTAPYSDKAIMVRKEVECAPCLRRECSGDHKCMTAVKSDDVIQAAEEQLNRYSPDKL